VRPANAGRLDHPFSAPPATRAIARG